MEEQAIQHKWYVVRVKGGQEKKISTYIEKEVNRLEWNDFVTQILVPTEKVYQIRKGKKVSKERNFFPSKLSTLMKKLHTAAGLTPEDLNATIDLALKI